MQVIFLQKIYSAIVNLKKNRNGLKFHCLVRGQNMCQKDQKNIKNGQNCPKLPKKRKKYLPDHDNGEIQNVPGTPQVRCRMLP